MKNYYNELNSEQLEATQNRDSSVIIAGAGSGKTRVIAAKTVQALFVDNILPEKIMLATFTNKAASEIKERIYDMTNNDVSIPYMGTLHSIFFSLLREGISKNIISPFYTKNVSIIGDTENYLTFSDAFGDYSHQSVKKIIYDAETKGCKNALSSKIYKTYVEDIETRNVITFDKIQSDLLLFMEKSPNFKKYCQNKFDIILVDESQDNSKLQFDILKIISRKTPIHLVGDDKQNLYSFRGASVETFISYTKRKKYKVFKLSSNYRSTGDIIDLADTIIGINGDKQIKHKSICMKEGEGSITIDEYDSMNDEYQAIVDQIEALLSSGISPHNISILFRKRIYVEQMRKFLLERGIPLDRPKGVGNASSVISIFQFFDSGAKTMLLSFAHDNFLTREWVDNMLGLMQGREIGIVDDTQKIILDAYKIFSFDKKSSLKKLTEILPKTERDVFLSDIEMMDIENVESLVLGGYYQNTISGVFVETIHRSKGLEFDVVFLPTLVRGNFSGGSRTYDPEEVRVLYVALTRAKRQLILSTVDIEMKYKLQGDSVVFNGTKIARESLLLDPIRKKIKDLKCKK